MTDCEATVRLMADAMTEAARLLEADRNTAKTVARLLRLTAGSPKGIDQ